MKNNWFIICVPVLICACKLSPTEDKRYSDPESVTYQIRLNPKPGSEYYYDMKSTTNTVVDLQENESEHINTTSAGIIYKLSKDSSGSYLFTMNYDKIHIYTKNNNKETEADTKNARYSINIVDKMLGALKEVTLVASVSPDGTIRKVSGYDELSQQLMDYLNTDDPNTRAVAQQQLNKVIGEGVVQKNLEQLFKLFPDSAIRVGDKWKIETKQSGDFNLNIKGNYKLTDINSELAFIESESEIESDKLPIAMMGYTVIPNLKGSQEGKYEIEAKTGMLLNGKVSSKLEGTMQIAGREVPVNIRMEIKIDGKRVK